MRAIMTNGNRIFGQSANDSFGCSATSTAKPFMAHSLCLNLSDCGKNDRWRSVVPGIGGVTLCRSFVSSRSIQPCHPEHSRGMSWFDRAHHDTFLWQHYALHHLLKHPCCLRPRNVQEGIEDAAVHREHFAAGLPLSGTVLSPVLQEYRRPAVHCHLRVLQEFE